MELVKHGEETLREEFFQLIRIIWKTEEMPKKLNSGTIMTVHKKGDRKLYKNYKGITLLNRPIKYCQHSYT